MNHSRTDVLVGIFVLGGVICLGYLAIRLGKLELFGNAGYVVYADFASVARLKLGDPVEIAGVKVGKVESLALADDRARITVRLEPQVKLQEDAIASVRARGLIGDKFVLVTPGASDKIIVPGQLNARFYHVNARHHTLALGLQLGVGDRHRGEERLGVRVLRTGEQRAARREFDDAAAAERRRQATNGLRPSTLSCPGRWAPSWVVRARSLGSGGPTARPTRYISQPATTLPTTTATSVTSSARSKTIATSAPTRTPTTAATAM